MLCTQLLDLVGGWACDDGVVLLAAPALQGILATAPFLTTATFSKFNVLAVLATAAVKQAEAAAAQAVLLSYDVFPPESVRMLSSCCNPWKSMCDSIREYNAHNWSRPRSASTGTRSLV